MDNVVSDHAIDIIAMRESVENMWEASSSKRERRTISSERAPGFSLYGDNIGKQSLFYRKK